MEPTYWRKCTTCKTPIAFKQVFWVCNVSTCNRKRTGMVFCQVSCWDAHVPVMNHKTSWAEERNAPGKEDFIKIQSSSGGSEAARAAPKDTKPPGKEVLIVASKLKEYIRRTSGGLSTGTGVMDTLSDQVREYCKEAIKVARQDGRKTVFDRDFRF